MRHIEQATTAVALAAAFLFSGCGGAAPGTRPGDMSAEEHARASEAHQAESQQHEAQYDSSATETRESRGGVPARGPDGVWATRTYNPTAGHHAEAREHHEHAEQHAAAAQALRQFEAAECRAFPPETRAACPLVAGVTGVEDVEGGVRMRFAPSVPVEAVLEHIRCHAAYARTNGYRGMPSCALYLRGVDVRAGPSGTVELVASDAATVRAIREQTRMHTATGAH